MKNFFHQFLWHFSLLLLVALFVLGLRSIDRSFPVVKNFRVTSQEVGETSVTIQGTVDKVRDCKILDISALTADGRPLKIDFSQAGSGEGIKTRPVRFQVWGPWEVFNKGSTSVTLYIHHACSIFWTQTTKLTDLTLITVEVPIAVPQQITNAAEEAKLNKDMQNAIK